MTNEQNKPASELRFNLVCKDWVVIATGRAKRPETFARDKSEREQDTSRDNCPFCDLGTQALPVLEYKNQAGEWTLAVVSN